MNLLMNFAALKISLNPQKLFALGLTLMLASGMLAFDVASAHANEVTPKTKSVVKKAAVGAGAGAILGGVSREGSALRGAGYGALSGLATGIIDNSSTLSGRPMVKDSLKGAAIGAGASAATGRSSVKGGLLGAGGGALWGWLRKNP